ncbi:MAG TPA: D-alanyl-D-alanine endopeptidase [Nevskiaceae bacterium]|nr:D-alanyl-D-alanine endopeptidase [Nevskiaceae bacterium]
MTTCPVTDARPPRPLAFRALRSLFLLVTLTAVVATPAWAATKSKSKSKSKVRAATSALVVKSNVALVVDQDTGEILVSKNADTVTPIASLTKLMTALVVIDGRLPMDEMLEIGDEDHDREKHTTSRLRTGTRLTRGDLMLLSLMSSENRAALALGRHYPGGRTKFVAAMNAKARSLGMASTRFADPAGLSSDNVSTARDLLRLLSAADAVDLIRNDSTQTEGTVMVRGRPLQFVNTNRLVRSASRDWNIGLQKTGFTNEAGRCLVMRATTAERRLSMVFLDSVGTLTRFADASRVRQHLLRQASAKRVPVSTPVALGPKTAS